MRKAGIKIGVRGFYRIYTTNAAGKVTHDTGVFPNLVTNGGLDYLGACPAYNVAYGINDFTAVCCVGVGNTAPAYTDTTLQSGVARVMDNSGNGCSVNKTYVPGPPAYWQGQRSWQFAAGSGSGNIAEVGVGPSISGSTAATQLLFSRALVVDGGGSPTVIPWLITEALTVTYILQYYFAITDQSYSMSLSGTSYSGVWRIAQCSTVPSLGISIGSNVVNASTICIVYNGSIGAITSSPSGSSSPSNAFVSSNSYTTGTYYRGMSYSFDINSGNLSGGISAIEWSTTGVSGFQMSVSPPIPKTNAYNMTLNANVSWARYP